ncbi:MAG: hypothetical protein J2P23_06300 [Microlunatus sp.]|nr:hypothetical protein [Microlunatus sp.]
MFLITLLLIAAVVIFLVRRGKIGPPPWVTGGTHSVGPGRFGPFSPEFEARRTLANRFANGEMSPEEFLERAAALNWTPGVDQRPDSGKKS